MLECLVTNDIYNNFFLKNNKICKGFPYHFFLKHAHMEIYKYQAHFLLNTFFVYLTYLSTLQSYQATLTIEQPMPEVIKPGLSRHNFLKKLIKIMLLFFLQAYSMGCALSINVQFSNI